MWDFIANSWLAILLTAVISYLLGSINWAIIITKLFTKKDIRTFGSGNAGATNVLRSQGVVPAVLTTVGDLAKAAASVAIGGWLLVNLNMSGSSPAFDWMDTENIRIIGQYLGGLFSIVGHIYPLYYGFHGGKGVMATLGMYFVLDWRVALLCLMLFLVIVAVGRMVSLGSVCASTYIPVLTFIFRCYVDELSIGTVIFCTVLSALNAAIIIFKHGSNMRRLAEGTERRIGEDKES